MNLNFALNLLSRFLDKRIDGQYRLIMNTEYQYEVIQGGMKMMVGLCPDIGKALLYFPALEDSSMLLDKEQAHGLAVQLWAISKTLDEAFPDRREKQTNKATS